MTLYFSNPGTLDIRLISTFGVNVKPQSQSPFGFFGSGMKYAIAGVLRLKGTIQIFANGEEYNLFSRKDTFRGKEVEMCFLQHNDGEPVALPFSTDLGPHWLPWMLYREFRCNAQDEGGQVTTSFPDGQDIIFCVNCAEVEKAHHQGFFLETKPLTTFDKVEVHKGAFCSIFYRGVLVHIAPKPYHFTYNILEPLPLTEDRTASSYSIHAAIVRNIARSATDDQAQILKAILDSDEKERDFEYPSWDIQPTPTFSKVMFLSVKQNKSNSSAKAWARGHSDDIAYNTQEPTEAQLALMQEMQTAIMPLILQLAPDASAPLVFISDEVYDMDNLREAIYIHPSAFEYDREGFFYLFLKAHLHNMEGGVFQSMAKLLFWQTFGRAEAEVLVDENSL